MATIVLDPDPRSTYGASEAYKAAWFAAYGPTVVSPDPPDYKAAVYVDELGDVRTGAGDRLLDTPDFRTFAVKNVTVDDLPASGIWSAHRGGGNAPFLAPDGSRSGFQTAISYGATIIDTDYQTTQDGILVAMHDATVDRTTPGTGNVSAFQYSQLPKLDQRFQCGDFWSPEPIPTLEELLAEFGGRAIITLEAKAGSSAVPPLAALIKKYGLERSVLINSSSTNVAATVTANGCLAHVWGMTTVGNVASANTAGAYMIELPYNVAPDILAAALAAPNIKRVVSGPLSRRSEVSAMTPGFHGYVSDGIGYLDRVPTGKTIAPEMNARRVGTGWRQHTSAASRTFPLYNVDGLNLSQETTSNRRDILLGSISGPKPGTYSISFTVKYGAWVADTTKRSSLRVCCTSDEGTGLDADTRGYVIGLRKSGEFNLWTAPISYGAGVLIGQVTAANGADIPDTGQTLVIRVDITPTTINVTREDTGQSLGPIANTDWRGDYMWVGGDAASSGRHDISLVSPGAVWA